MHSRYRQGMMGRVDPPRSASQAREARAIIRGLDLWPAPPRLEPIAAGYTNENFRVLAAGETYFARAGTDLPHHGISRRDEAACARLAAGAGIAPEVLHARGGVLVTRFIAGKTLKMGEALDDATLVRVGRLLAEVHRLPAPPELKEANLAGACRRYLDLPGSARLPADDRRRLEELLARAPALEAWGLAHGDAFPENFIDDGRRLWLVDWEYAGRGHPASDLAYVAMNFGLAAGGIRKLLAAHGGAVDLPTVEALLPLAAARDFLWCLIEVAARGLTAALDGYARLCGRRLGLAWTPAPGP